MKTLANLEELRSSAFTSFMDEINQLASRLGLRIYSTWSKTWEYPWIEQRVSELVKPGTRVLDIGSELSPMPWRWAMRGAQVWMVETNAEPVALWESCRAQLRAEGRLPLSAEAIQWQIVEDERLPFEDGAFDLVSSLSVIEHVCDRQRAIDEAVRVLRPGGCLAMSFDICEPDMGMTFPSWNGRTLTLSEFDELIWRHPSLTPLVPDVEWNVEDIPEFLAWHRTTAEHHNYVVGAAIMTKRPYPADVKSVLVTRLDGLGDIVLGTSLLFGLRRRWPNAQITLLVRPPHASLSAIVPDWVNLVVLPFDPREPVTDRTSQIVADLRRTADECRSQVCIIAEYNRAWADDILAELCGAESVFSFSGPPSINAAHDDILAVLKINVNLRRRQVVQVDEGDPELRKYSAMLSAIGEDELPLPSLIVSEDLKQQADKVWKQLGLQPTRTVICFPGSGEQLKRSADAAIWARWIDAIMREHRCSVLLLGGPDDAAALNEIEAAGLPDAVRLWMVEPEDFGLLAALLLSCKAYIGADTGPMHVAAVLGRPTLGLFGGGTWPRFLPVGPRTMAVRMPMACYGCGWLCPFERRYCIKDIPFEAIKAAGDRFLSEADEHEPLETRIVDVAPSTAVHQGVAGAVMRIHRQLLNLNHRVLEDNTLQRQRADQQAKTLAAMTEQNCGRDRAIEALGNQTHQHVLTLAAMTEQNRRRDQAIETLGNQTHKHVLTLAEMTEQNRTHENAVAMLRQQIAALQQQLADLRKRSLRIPAVVCRLFGRLRGLFGSR